ncbi:MAG: hypothetical protein AAF824_01310 [Bacteroidota bacterium]
MNKVLTIIVLAGSLLTASSCNELSSHSADNGAPSYEPWQPSEEFKKHWYSGKAEVASFALQQSRYGDLHQGNAVMIFVAEDFSLSKQVKLDYPRGASNDKTSILKMNMVKKFTTGIYPYSMMLSVFTPVERGYQPHTLKTSTTIQEWCGHVFSQLNLREEAYELKEFSYFESEGDSQRKLPTDLLEDEVWSLIKLDPTLLPTGKHDIIPGAFNSRLRHNRIQAVRAEMSLSEADEKGIRTYSIFYPSRRTLAIAFDQNFPYTIMGWTETLPSGQQTIASRKTGKMIDYWTRNDPSDSYLRDELSLPN